MNDLIHEFLVWSVGFVIVSAMTLLAGHLLARRARKARSAATADGLNSEDAPKRRPAWGTALIVVFAYLLLLGPLLQGVSRTFRSDDGDGIRQPAAEASILPGGNRAGAGESSASRGGEKTKEASADCPCRTKQREAGDGAAASNSPEKESATIESRGLVESK